MQYSGVVLVLSRILLCKILHNIKVEVIEQNDSVNNYFLTEIIKLYLYLMFSYLTRDTLLPPKNKEIIFQNCSGQVIIEWNCTT